MRAFWQVVKIAIRQQLTYRTAIVAGLVTNLFFGLLRAALYIALMDNQGTVNQMTANSAVNYAALTQALISFLTVFGSFDLMKEVYSGGIGSDLLKPMSLYRYWMGKDLGKSLINLLLRGVLLLIAFNIFYPVELPKQIDLWLLLIPALILAWLNSFAWRFLVNLASFWTPDAIGIGRLAFGVSQFLSGFIMPLRFFPDWFHQLTLLTPFPSMVNAPVEIYLGLLDLPQILQVLGLQLAWFIGLTALAHFVMRRGIRRLVVQGG